MDLNDVLELYKYQAVDLQINWGYELVLKSDGDICSRWPIYGEKDLAIQLTERLIQHSRYRCINNNGEDDE